MNWEILATVMDVQQPDWFISYANEQELKDFARARAAQRAAAVSHTPTAVGIARATESLCRAVAQRLEMPVRAAVHSRLVIEVVYWPERDAALGEHE